MQQEREVAQAQQELAQQLQKAVQEGGALAGCCWCVAVMLWCCDDCGAVGHGCRMRASACSHQARCASSSMLCAAHAAVLLRGKAAPHVASAT